MPDQTPQNLINIPAREFDILVDAAKSEISTQNLTLLDRVIQLYYTFFEYLERYGMSQDARETSAALLTDSLLQCSADLGVITPEILARHLALFDVQLDKIFVVYPRCSKQNAVILSKLIVSLSCDWIAPQIVPPTGAGFTLTPLNDSISLVKNTTYTDVAIFTNDLSGMPTGLDYTLFSIEITDNDAHCSSISLVNDGGLHFPQLRLVPETDYIGIGTFKYKLLYDGEDVSTRIATVSLSINEAIAPPTATDFTVIGTGDSITADTATHVDAQGLIYTVNIISHSVSTFAVIGSCVQLHTLPLIATSNTVVYTITNANGTSNQATITYLMNQNPFVGTTLYLCTESVQGRLTWTLNTIVASNITNVHISNILLSVPTATPNSIFDAVVTGFNGMIVPANIGMRNEIADIDNTNIMVLEITYKENGIDKTGRLTFTVPHFSLTENTCNTLPSLFEPLFD